MHSTRHLHTQNHLQTFARSLSTHLVGPRKVPRTSVTCQDGVSVRWWWMVRCFHWADQRKRVCVCTCIQCCWKGSLVFASGVLGNPEVNCQSQSAWKSRVKVRWVRLWLYMTAQTGLYVKWHSSDMGLWLRRPSRLDLPCLPCQTCFFTQEINQNLWGEKEHSTAWSSLVLRENWGHQQWLNLFYTSTTASWFTSRCIISRVSCKIL